MPQEKKVARPKKRSGEDRKKLLFKVQTYKFQAVDEEFEEN